MPPPGSVATDVSTGPTDENGASDLNEGDAPDRASTDELPTKRQRTNNESELNVGHGSPMIVIVNNVCSVCNGPTSMPTDRPYYLCTDKYCKYGLKLNLKCGGCIHSRQITDAVMAGLAEESQRDSGTGD